jgi:hypothetical protein
MWNSAVLFGAEYPEIQNEPPDWAMFLVHHSALIGTIESTRTIRDEKSATFFGIYG